MTSLTIVATEGQNFIGLDNVSVQCLSPLGAKGLCNKRRPDPAVSVDVVESPGV